MPDSLHVIDLLRSLAEGLRDADHFGAADIVIKGADHIEALSDQLLSIEDEREALRKRLDELEHLFDKLATACLAGRLACNLSEGDSVPVLEVRR